MIELEYSADFVALTITDDGVGFNPDDALEKSGHFGLRGIRRRATKLDGEFTVRSAPDAGTSIQVKVPLSSGTSAPHHAEASRVQ